MEQLKHRGYDLIDWGYAVDIYKDGEHITQMPSLDKAKELVDFDIDKANLKPLGVRLLEELEEMILEDKRKGKE